MISNSINSSNSSNNNNTRSRSNTYSPIISTNNNNYDHNYDIIKKEFYKLSNNVLSIYDSLNNYCDSIKSIYLNQNSFLNNSFNYFDSEHPISKFSNQVIPQIETVFNEWGNNQSNNFQLLVEFCNQLDNIRLKIESYDNGSGNGTDESLKSEIFKDVKYQFDSRVNGFDIPLINIQFSLNSLLSSISTIQNDSSINLQNKINFINPILNINIGNNINNKNNNNNNGLFKSTPQIYNSLNNSNSIINNNNNNNSNNKPPIPSPSIIKKTSLKPLARPSSVEIPKVEAPENMYRGEKEKDLPGQHITPPPREIHSSPQQNVTPTPRLELLKQHTRVNSPQQPPRFQPPTPSNNNNDNNIVPVRPAPIPNSNISSGNSSVSRPRAQSVNYSSPPLQQNSSSTQILPSRPASIFPKPSPQSSPSLQQRPPPQPNLQSNNTAPQTSPIPPRPITSFQKPQPTLQSNNLVSQPSLHSNNTTPQTAPIPPRPITSFQKPQPTLQSNNLVSQPPQQQSRPLPSFSRPQANLQQNNNLASQSQIHQQNINNNNCNNNLALQYSSNQYSSNFCYQRPLPATKPQFLDYILIEDKKPSKPVSSFSSSSSSSSKKGFSLSGFMKDFETSINNNSGGGFLSMSSQGGYRCALTGRETTNDPKIEDLVYDYEKHRKIFGNGKRFKLCYSYVQTILYKKIEAQYTLLKGNPVSSLLLYIFEPISMQSQNIINANIIFSDSDGNIVEPTKIEHLQNVLCAEFKSPKVGQTFKCTYEITADLYSCTLLNASPNEVIQVEPITDFEREFYTRPTPKLNFDKPEFAQFINDNFLSPQQYSDGTIESQLCFSYRCSVFIKYHIKYQLDAGDQEPLETMRKGVANCGSYCNLFSSIMRYNGLPCRILKGLVCRKEIDGGMPHAQNEVYLEGIGWLPYNGAFLETSSLNTLAFSRSFGDHFTLALFEEKGIFASDNENYRNFQGLNIKPPSSSRIGTEISDFTNYEDIKKIDNYDCQLI